MEKKKIIIFWSGGKNSALALHTLRQDPSIEIKALITTIVKESNTVAFHGISESLLVEQAKLIGIPLQRIYLPENCSNEIYQQKVGSALELYRKNGIKGVAFGDISLKDVRLYREKQLEALYMKAIFPLWGKDTEEISSDFMKLGFRAIVTSVLKDKLSSDFLRSEYNQDFLRRLPKEIDSIGENGEFHTLVTFGPGFKMRLQTSISVTRVEGPYEVCQIRLP